MDFALSDDQRLLKDTIRQFMEAEVRPHLREYEKQEHFPADELRRLGELGCCGMTVPEEWGGTGSDTLTFVLMLEEVARVCASTAVTLSVTNSVVASPIARHGTDEQKRNMLTRLARGEWLGAFCLTEPQAGSDSAGIETRAAPAADGSWRVTGTKSWVTNGGVASVYLVFAKTDPAAGARGVTAFLVTPDLPGFRVARFEDKMGLKMSKTAEIRLDECQVPAANRLGEPGQGLKIALEALDGGRVGIAAQALGIAEGALDASVRYAKERRAFGKKLGEFQGIQWMLADMQTEIEAARMLTYHAACVQDEARSRGLSPLEGHVGPHASRAKLYASEMVNRVAYKAVQVHGSMGYSREMDVERAYRDARVVTIYEGTSEIQRTVIARELRGAGARETAEAKA